MNRGDLLYRWLRLGQSGITLERLLGDRKLYKIALYGYDQIADCILYELEKSSIVIDGIIDRKGSQILVEYRAYKPNDIRELKVDAIIVMPVDDFQSIKLELMQYTSTDIISIEEILYEL